MEKKVCLICDKYNEHAKGDSLLHVIIIGGGGVRLGLLWKKKCVSYAIEYNEHAKGDSLLHVIIIWGWGWGLPMGEKMCLLCDKYNKHTKGDSLLHVIIIWGWGLPMENVPPMR